MGTIRAPMREHWIGKARENMVVDKVVDSVVTVVGNGVKPVRHA